MSAQPEVGIVFFILAEQGPVPGTLPLGAR
jgi:hypothetical protein